MKNRVVGLLRAALSQWFRFVLMSIFLSTFPPPLLVHPCPTNRDLGIYQEQTASLSLSFSLALLSSRILLPLTPYPNHPSPNHPSPDILHIPCPACKTFREFQLETSELDRLNIYAEWRHYPFRWNRRAREQRGQCRTFLCTALVIESIEGFGFIETDSIYQLKCVIYTTLNCNSGSNENTISLRNLFMVHHYLIASV